MKTLFRSLAIVAGVMLVPLAMPATANAGYYGNYSNYSGCQHYAPRYSSYNYHRRHSVTVVIVIRKHHRHNYATYMAGPAYRYGGY